MSETVCVWCQRGYSLDDDGTHYVNRGEHGCEKSQAVKCAAGNVIRTQTEQDNAPVAERSASVASPPAALPGRQEEIHFQPTEVMPSETDDRSDSITGIAVATAEYHATRYSASPAAPLSTLPERPEPVDTEQLRDASRAYIGIPSRVLMRAAADEIEWLRSRLSSLERELDGVRNELANSAQCPCTFVGPCHDRCTCINPVSSHGCRRCVRYGSAEQQMAAARRLATIIDAASPSALRERSE